MTQERTTPAPSASEPGGNTGGRRASRSRRIIDGSRRPGRGGDGHRSFRIGRPETGRRQPPVRGRARLAGGTGLPDHPRPPPVRRGLAGVHRRRREPRPAVCRPAGQPREARSRPARAVQLRAGRAEARPLFFFDSDGSRAGALWYIRRVTVDRVDPQLARREAEDIGLKDRVAWESATGYVQRLEAAKSHPATRTLSARPNRRRPRRPRANRTDTDQLSRSSRRSSPALRIRLPDPRIAELAAGRRDAGHRPVSAAGLLDAHGDPRCDREGSGQSAGTGASTTITSPRVG